MLHATAFEDATGGVLELDLNVYYSNSAILHATAFEDATRVQTLDLDVK